MTASQPKSMPHAFSIPVLQAYFVKNPLPERAIGLIDMKNDEFTETEEEMNLLTASLYVISVTYDSLSEKPKDKDGVRSWIVKHRNVIVDSLAKHVEPPFPAITIEMVQRNVGAMLDELLAQANPPVLDKKKQT